MPGRTQRVALEGPIDPVRTLRRLSLFTHDPTTKVKEGAVWCAFATPEGSTTVRYRAASEREVDVSAWGPGAEHAHAHAAEHLGARDLVELETDHPLLAPLAVRFRGLRFGRTRRVIEALLPAILGQKVTGAGASRSWKELLFRYGERAPDAEGAPPLWIPPSPARFRELAYFDFHPLGVERKRATTMLEVARRARRLERIVELDPEAAHAQLVALPGIGPWTAAHVLNAALGDADAVAVGDYHLPHLVTHAFTGEPRGDDARMLELLEPFRPHRGRVVAWLMAAGHSAPRFGPRLPVRDIRHS